MTVVLRLVENKALEFLKFKFASLQKFNDCELRRAVGQNVCLNKLLHADIPYFWQDKILNLKQKISKIKSTFLKMWMYTFPVQFTSYKKHKITFFFRFYDTRVEAENQQTDVTLLVPKQKPRC